VNAKVRRILPWLTTAGGAVVGVGITWFLSECGVG
jgi:hypothetical protein